MYTWEGSHHVGYIQLVIVLLKVDTMTSQKTEYSSDGHVVIAEKAFDTGDIYTWHAYAKTKPGADIFWIVHCTNKDADCNEPTGEPAFTCASDINHDIRAFIADQLTLLAKRHKIK